MSERSRMDRAEGGPGPPQPLQAGPAGGSPAHPGAPRPDPRPGTAPSRRSVACAALLPPIRLCCARRYNLLSYLVAAAVRTFLTILPWQFFISGGALVFLTVSLHRLQCLRFTHS